MSFFVRAAGLCALLLVAQSSLAIAEDYPSRTVRFIVPFEAGGGVDATARYLSQQLSQQLNQSYVVENKPGISGITGTELVSNSKPDGYTLLYASDTLAVAPSLLPNLSLDMLQDITPITVVGVAPYVFVVNPKVPVKTPPELVSYIKTHPGGFRWGIGGMGTPGQLAIERFSKAAGIKAEEVPYKGNAPASVATLSGEVDGMVASPTAIKTLVESGKLTGLGVASLTPIESMPDMPLMASFGYPGFEAVTWFAIWGPKKMPADLAKQIRDQVAKAASNPDVVKKFAGAGLTVRVSESPAAFATYFKSELEKDGEIMRGLNFHGTGP